MMRFALGFVASALLAVSYFVLHAYEPATGNPDRPALAEKDYASHVAALRRRLPGSGFTVVVERPFVVVGDEAPEVVRRRAEGTVRWAVRRLESAFFDREPRQILDIWLFRDEKSYREHSRALFGFAPTTPFGFYSDSFGALVMNISTGEGTLVHEIVHPFVDADFPGCPPWMNEGLGSLYEQCAEVEGEIRGRPNWRLPGLKKRIRRGSLPTIRRLTSLTANEFYAGENYAQSRYLLYYLEQRELLRTYYRCFRDARAEDPTGYATLCELLGNPDMAEFQKQWESWVLEIRY